MDNKMTKAESIKKPKTFNGLVKYTKEVIKGTNFVFEYMPRKIGTYFLLKIMLPFKLL